MDTLARPAVIPPQPDPLIPALALFLTDRSRPASTLADYLPPPVLSDLEAYMSASITAATLKASS